MKLTKRLLKAIAWLIGLSVIAFGALIGLIWYEGRQIQSGMPEYVALGSSFASGPGVTERAPGSPMLCGRSKDNYPHLLAAKRKLALIDVSCGGATTAHVLNGGQYFQHAQIEAVKPETKLVTITIGGNNIAYMSNMMAAACANAPELTPWFWRKIGICKETTQAEVDRRFSMLGASMSDIVRLARLKAPKARIVFLSLQTVVPAIGSCPRLHMTEAQADRSRREALRLLDLTRKVAEAQGAELFDVAALTAEHAVCSTEPWIEGVVYPATIFNNAPMIFHTNLAGMRAIAAGLDVFLGAPR